MRSSSRRSLDDRRTRHAAVTSAPTCRSRAPARQYGRVQADPEIQARVLRDRAAQRPILDDLRSIGIDIESVWDLYKVENSRPRAVPVLLKHLTLDYPDGVLMSIGQGLDDKSARPWWPDLRVILVDTQREVVRDRVACAMATCATKEHYDDLQSFIRNASLGDSRIYFLRPINRIGNRIGDGQGRALMQSLADDPLLGKEATAILKGRSRSQ